MLSSTRFNIPILPEYLQVAGEAWRKLLNTLVAAEKLVDVFEYYGVDKYLTSSGLTVLPGHRGQNIGAKIIAVR